VDEGQPIAILAVDDEPGVLALVRRCLDERRIRLFEASSGADALERLPLEPTLDLLITDLRMPGMEGDELARRVRALRPDIRVLYLTSHADRLFEATTGLRADEAYLEKPFTREGLREAAAQLIFGVTKFHTPPPGPADETLRHDFKNQLAVIRGFAEILLAEAAPADPRRVDFEEIRKAAVTALDLLARLHPEAADEMP
jgi:CheY-like chemotaxis protein